MSSPHVWQFFRAGGVDQVVIREGADIAHLRELDQKLWVALACPTRGVEFDTRTLDLIDADHDGRIRAPELIAACEWAVQRLRDPDELVRPGDTLSLDALADEVTVGPQGAPPVTLTEAARRILAVRGKAESDRLSLADVTDRAELLAAQRFNGDGVVTLDSSDDPELRELIGLIAQTQGSLADRGGRDGVDRARAEAFFAQADALQAWQAARGDADLAALDGDAAQAAARSIEAVRAKVDDFFTRCRLADYDARAASALNPTVDALERLGQQTLNDGSEELARLPLAAIRAAGELPLRAGLNPAWADAVDALRRNAVEPLLGLAGASHLSEDAWRSLKRRLAACSAWLEARPHTSLDALSSGQLRRAAQRRPALTALIAEDEAAESRNARIDDLEKLLRLKRDLLALLHNFVSFHAFYRREGAIFQAGTLYLDSRSCDLTVRVDDVARHAALAGLAKTCLAYCQCTREGRTMTIAAAFTAGDIDFLFVGRNGLFYDRQGQDWDATITRIIENPTSVAQAFFSPYKKFLRAIEEQVARRAAASDALAQGALDSLAGNVGAIGKTPAAGAKPPAPIRLPGRIDVGTVAALGVALGSISAVLVAIFGKFVDLGVWIPVALLGIVLAISGPSMLIAWLKLRQRSLGPILDACGWAINGRMRVNVRLGGSLSRTAHIPKAAHRSLIDPFADRRGFGASLALLAIAAGVLALAWRTGWLPPLWP